jgi:hypothetical protein
MSDNRIVQCFGVRVRPKKPARYCGRQFLWTARGAAEGNFGRKGAQACPHCGTLPDFAHPINRYLNGELSQEQAEDMLDDYYAAKEN